MHGARSEFILYEHSLACEKFTGLLIDRTRGVNTHDNVTEDVRPYVLDAQTLLFLMQCSGLNRINSSHSRVN